MKRFHRFALVMANPRLLAPLRYNCLNGRLGVTRRARVKASQMATQKSRKLEGGIGCAQSMMREGTRYSIVSALPYLLQCEGYPLEVAVIKMSRGSIVAQSDETR